MNEDELFKNLARASLDKDMQTIFDIAMKNAKIRPCFHLFLLMSTVAYESELLAMLLLTLLSPAIDGMKEGLEEVIKKNSKKN